MAEAFIHPLSDSLFSASSVWTKEENKRFERALALFDEKTPDRWRKVAEMIPGKSMWDVMRQYRELEEDVSVIEAGLVDGVARFRASFKLRKTSSTAARHHHHEQERRKGVPWTEEEHRRFLLGLEKHGKGDWRSISRNFVISKTPTQVASHAQKYFLRQLSIGKDKKRPSIHDITTANLMMPPPPSKLNKPNHPLQLQFQLQNLYSCG